MITYTSTPDYYNDYIAHYGILGMKWGHRKLDRQLAKTDKARNKTLKRRSKFQSFKNKRFTKKIEKAKAKGKLDKVKKLQNKKRNFNIDYNKGTKGINNAYKYRSDVIKNYKKTQDAAIKDKSTKKSSAYKLAKTKYLNQRLMDIYSLGNPNYSVIGYYSDKVNGNHNYTVNEEKLKKKYKKKYGK